MYPDDEDEVESPVLTSSPLTPVLLFGGLVETIGETVELWGNFITAIGRAHAAHFAVNEERRAFEAAVVTEIEKITGE